MQPNRRPTIKDVASAAGVSPTTVSHALSGKGVVRKETADRVKEIATQIGYRPSAIASGLRRERMGLIALVIRPLEALDTFLLPGVDYFFRIAGFASLTAMEHGYSLMIVDDPTKHGAPVSALAADAYVVVEPYEDDHVLSYLASASIPIVAVGADIARRDSFVALDTRASEQANQILSHLTERGAKRIALAAGADRNAWNTDVTQAYLDWCERSGQDPLWTSIPEAAGERAGEQMLDEFFTPGVEAPDAIFCLLGRQAAGLVRAATERGIRVPEDLLVASGSEALSLQTQHPTVTTLDLQPDFLAQRAVEAAVALIEGRELEQPLMAPDAILRERESTRRN